MILTNVKKQLGGFTLHVEKLAISKPGVYGLIGPNGSGKTTLAKIMAGLMRPDSGDVDTESLQHTDITFLDRKPYMTDDNVYNNLVYPLKLRGMKPDPGTTAMYIEMMKLKGREKQKAARLSAGEQQKLAFLRAVIFKPKLIIADEAMTAMDMDALDQFESLIPELQKETSQTWIIISHQMPQIRHLCDHIYFINEGRIITEAAADDFFARNANPLVDKYMRSYNG